MICDDVCARIEALLPARARELDVEFDVRWGTVPVSAANGEPGQMVLLSLLFSCRSALLGQPPVLHVETVPINEIVGAGDGFLEQLLTSVCELFREVRAESLKVAP